MKILTNSVWFYGHLDNLELLDKNKKLFRYIHARNNLSGKVNICFNKNILKKRHWSKNIPLATYLLNKKKIVDNGHYYVNYPDGEKYSIFYKDGVIYPFSDRICSNEIVKDLQKLYKIEDSYTVNVEKKMIDSDERMVNRNYLIFVITVIFISLSFFTANIFNR